MEIDPGRCKMTQDLTNEVEAFFTLHRDLPREGPGEAADVAWAAALANLPPDGDIADVACGPGADIAALLAAVPDGHVTAVDKTAHYVAAARAAWRDDPRVMVLRADMARIMNSYDLIWCAGAVYFMGVTEALATWRKSLKPGGTVAFSEPCWFTDHRDPRAQANWADYPAMTDEAGILARVAEADYEVLGKRKVSDAAWEAYYTPLDARIKKLRPGADAALASVLDAATLEAANWRSFRRDCGYLLVLARPL